jgi:hypothetical protein
VKLVAAHHDTTRAQACEDKPYGLHGQLLGHQVDEHVCDVVRDQLAEEIVLVGIEVVDEPFGIDAL